MRPFSQRELDMNSENVIEMEDNKTRLVNLKTQKRMEFILDYSLWSFDEYSQKSCGYLTREKGSDRYMD